MSALPPARILEVTPDEYHKLPGFSASLAKILIARSPAHAKDAADRHAEAIADEDDDDVGISDDKQKRLDAGSILHALILGIGKRVEVVPSTILSKNGAYGTAESKAARDAARAAGRIPVKEPDMPRYEHVAGAIRSKIAAAGHVLDGISELAIEWWDPTSHGPVQCRAMLDHSIIWSETGARGPTGAIIYDLKCVADASHERSERSAESLGYGIQVAAYTRALNALHPSLAGRIEFRFLFAETGRPYELWDPTPDGMFRELGEQRWRRAVLAWAECQALGRWTGLRIPERKEITAPMWALRREGFTADE